MNQITRYTLISNDELSRIYANVKQLKADIERLQAQIAPYDDYIKGKITLGQLEQALIGAKEGPSQIDPLYQQKQGPEWVEPGND